ncbi:MAG: DUF2281 domain-containing protein [Bacteroidetes bacterium]|nr:DUF2281 domain-containing protein [Bacteroidota bacterium]
MSDLVLFTRLISLPAELKAEVAQFIESLLAKYDPKKQPRLSGRKPGSAKGMIIMAPDFDEPLEDFKEYM